VCHPDEVRKGVGPPTSGLQPERPGDGRAPGATVIGLVMHPVAIPSDRGPLLAIWASDRRAPHL